MRNREDKFFEKFLLWYTNKALKTSSDAFYTILALPNEKHKEEER